MKLLKKIEDRWKHDLQRQKLNVKEWKSNELLQKAKDAFLTQDRKAQAQAAEQIRIQIAYALLQKALAVNNLDLCSPTSEPSGGQCVDENDISSGRLKLIFFSGTSGERIIISSEGLRLPWVFDELHYTRKTNMLLRETLKELYPNAHGQDGEDLIVAFS